MCFCRLLIFFKSTFLECHQSVKQSRSKLLAKNLNYHWLFFNVVRKKCANEKKNAGLSTNEGQVIKYPQGGLWALDPLK